MTSISLCLYVHVFLVFYDKTIVEGKKTCIDFGASNQPDSTPNINWSRAVERGDVLLYARTVSSVVSSLPSNSCQSVTELNDKISHVCHVLR